MMRGGSQQQMRGGFQQQNGERRQWPNNGQQQMGGDLGKQNPNYKTVLCKNFQRDGACLYEDKCMYAHGAHELRKNPRRKNNQPPQQMGMPMVDMQGMPMNNGPMMMGQLPMMGMDPMNMQNMPSMQNMQAMQNMQMFPQQFQHQQQQSQQPGSDSPSPQQQQMNRSMMQGSQFPMMMMPMQQIPMMMPQLQIINFKDYVDDEIVNKVLTLQQISFQDDTFQRIKMASDSLASPQTVQQGLEQLTALANEQKLQFNVQTMPENAEMPVDNQQK